MSAVERMSPKAPKLGVSMAWGAQRALRSSPAHAMTATLALELPGALRDSAHQRALFALGLMLLTISLTNQLVARRLLRQRAP